MTGPLRNDRLKISATHRTLILPLESPDATLERVGGKGASLARLAAAGLPVPVGFHVTTEAYRRFVAENELEAAILAAAAGGRVDDPATLDEAAARIASLMAAGIVPADIAAAVADAYRDLGADEPAVAVRSSATAEDLPGMSFAGQQETYLNARGAEAVLAGVKLCWASLWTARAIGYRARQGIASRDVSVAVVVQRLVPAEVAGILFTANPITGARDQAVINAAWGLGEAIVGGLVTPDTIVVDKASGVVVSQDIADKAVMTVRLPNGTGEAPVPDERRRLPAISAPEAVELVELGGRIEALYGQPMDIEWAICDARIAILQARPITALPEPRPTLAWDVPRAAGKYARSSVIELLPDPLTPLFRTLALPSWNQAMLELMQPLGLPADIALIARLVTIHDYAYYDFGMTASQTTRMLAAMLSRPRLLVQLLSTAQARWADEARPAYSGVVATWTDRDLPNTPATALLDGAHEVVRAAATHYLTIQGGILPVAYMSEAAFTGLYDRLARRPGDPPALTFMLGFDSTPIRGEKSLYDLATWARAQPALADYLGRAPSQDIATAFRSPGSPSADIAGWDEFRQRLSEHLGQFGHGVYDLDFAKSLPEEEPAPLLEALKYFLTGRARDPHVRQADAAEAREVATRALLGRLRWLRLRLFRWVLGAAQRYAPLREDALADVGLGWPLVRRMMGELGRRLTAARAVDQAEDIFWLEWDEVVDAARALDAGQPPTDLRTSVAARRKTWDEEHRVTPPVSLPLKGGATWLGMDMSRFMPARTEQADGDVLEGNAASPGRITGTARVIHGPDEFSHMRQGDILVAKITTPAWTPLFALAGGIVTDIGGPLSHGSIVAREYRIPAVLGTGLATARITSGQAVTVDGDEGTVTLER